MNIEAVYYAHSKLMYGQLLKEDIYVWVDCVFNKTSYKELAGQKVFTFYDEDRKSVLYGDIIPASIFKESDLTYFIELEEVPNFLYDNYGVILDEKQTRIFKGL